MNTKTISLQVRTHKNPPTWMKEENSFIINILSKASIDNSVQVLENGWVIHRVWFNKGKQDET